MTTKQPNNDMKTRHLIIRQQPCPQCKGSGEIKTFLLGLTYSTERCPTCLGGKFTTELIDLELALAELQADAPKT